MNGFATLMAKKAAEPSFQSGMPKMPTAPSQPAMAPQQPRQQNPYQPDGVIMPWQMPGMAMNWSNNQPQPQQQPQQMQMPPHQQMQQQLSPQEPGQSWWDTAQSASEFLPLLSKRIPGLRMAPGAVAAGRHLLTGETPNTPRYAPNDTYESYVGKPMDALFGFGSAVNPAGLALNAGSDALDRVARGTPTREEITGASGGGVDANNPNSFFGKYNLKGKGLLGGISNLGAAMAHPMDAADLVGYSVMDGLKVPRARQEQIRDWAGYASPAGLAMKAVADLFGR